MYSGPENADTPASGDLNENALESSENSIEQKLTNITIDEIADENADEGKNTKRKRKRNHKKKTDSPDDDDKIVSGQSVPPSIPISQLYSNGSYILTDVRKSYVSS